MSRAPRVQGACPECGGSLILGSGGYVTCTRIGCPNPSAPSEVLMADGGVEVKSPFEKHDYGPEDIAGHVYFAYQQTDEGRPQLVWDIQMEGVHPTIRLEMAEHFEALSNSIKNSYWSYVHDEAGDDAPLTPTEDRTYE